MAIPRSRENAQHSHHETAGTQQSAPDDQYQPAATTPATGLRARAICLYELFDRPRLRSQHGRGRWRLGGFIATHSPALMSLTITRRLRSSLTATSARG